MAPTVDRLARAGFPVRKIDLDANRAAAKQYRVTNVPCFVMLVDGREVDRVVGQTSYERLRKMFARGQTAPPRAALEPTRFQSPARGRVANATTSRRRNSTARTDATSDALDPRLLSASVRLKIQQPDSSSFGSGTIIDVRGDEALVLTCGHLFEENSTREEITDRIATSITVEVFDGGRVLSSTGRLVEVDRKSDLALVSFRTKGPVRVVRVAPAGFKVARGDAVVNVGGDHGAPPTARYGRILAIDSFVGPANFKVSGQPVQGRSGGGLFTTDSDQNAYTIGVCNFADPTDQAGGYAALRAIHALLDDVGLSDVYRAKQRPAIDRRVPRAVSHANSAGDSTGHSMGGGRAMYEGRSNVEVICIIRNRNRSAGGNQVIVLEQASHAFLRKLASERAAQQQRHQTSLSVGRSLWRAADEAPRGTPSKAGWAPRWKPAR
jgi:S1-C subfamily serine protease